MQGKHPVLEALSASTDACACLALRKATRVATQAYDRCLEPAGLTTVQFSLLATLYHIETVSMKQLATRLVMDRTSLTRTLAPLKRRGFIDVVYGADRRSRLITITVQGLEILISALPYWQDAQQRMVGGLGDAGWDQLQSALRQAMTAARSATSVR
jgi:DNA-binding MarR family transcriptional regulator